MSELTLAQPEQLADPNEIIESLAGKMREYDDMMQQRSALRDAEKIAIDQLEGINIDILLEHHPSHVAYNALQRILIEKKIEAIDQQVKVEKKALSESAQPFYEARGRGLKLRAQSLREPKSIHSRKADTWGLRTFDSRTGPLSYINLDPATGGYIHIKGKRGRIYHVSPLVVRWDDYSPAFSLEFVD